MEQLERCPCAHQEGHRVNSPALGTPISTTYGETLSRSEGERRIRLEALKHFSCDACSRLKQPPARRQVAIAHAEMFNDVVSMDVNFWTFKERQQREEDVDRSEHRGRSIGNAHRIPSSNSDISRAVEDFRAWLASLGWCAEGVSEWVLIVNGSARKSFFQAEGRGIFVDPVHAEAHWHTEASREPCETSSDDREPNGGSLGH